MATNKGFFLHDFFGRILPGDRNLFTPILEYLKWRRLTRNLALLSWVALWLAICGAFSFSFINNMRILHGFTNDFSQPPALTADLSDNLLIMDKFCSELIELQKANSNWWIPRFGLNKSVEFEKRLKKQYVKLFKEGFLDPMDLELYKRLEQTTSDTPGSEIMLYAEHFVARISLIRAHLEGKSFKGLDYVVSILTNILPLLDNDLLPQIATKFGNIYYYHLKWSAKKLDARLKMKELQAALKVLISKKRTNLYWLVDWANADPAIKDVTLEDFWGPEGPKKTARRIVVEGAFITDGYKRIGDFIKYFEKALSGLESITDKKKEFNLWYRKKYFLAWRRFAYSFYHGEHNLNGLDERRAMAAKMTTPDNPYFELIELMSKELEPFANEKDSPLWVKQLIDFQKISEMASRERKANENISLLTKIKGKGVEIAGEVKKKIKTDAESEAVKRHIYASAALNAYLQNLEELFPVSSARSQAYKAASDFFPYSLKPSESKSPFFSAFGEIHKLNTYLTDDGNNPVFLKLFSGPLHFLARYVSMETACYLQSNWEDIVLGEIHGVSQDRLPVLLFGKEGVVWKFVKGAAAPFLGRDQDGYFVKKAKGHRIPFKNDFISFLTQGSESKTSIKPEYKVMVKALPVDINDDAKKEPYEVILELLCSKGKTRLVNYNYPIAKTFVWSSQGGCDVSLQINFEGLSLVKEYAGYNSFPIFLADFRNGSKSFTPDDFPESKGILREMNVRKIKVRYEFKDNIPVIELLNRVPQKIPETIAYCWESQVQE